MPRCCRSEAYGPYTLCSFGYADGVVPGDCGDGISTSLFEGTNGARDPRLLDRRQGVGGLRR